MPHAIKPILAFFITATIALFLVAKEKILPGQAGVKVEAEKKAVDKTPTAEQRRALEVLDRIFASANRFKPDDQGWTYELKMKLQAQIADAVWDYDQARARRLFEQAFQPIKQGVPEDAVTVSANMKLNFLLVGSSSEDVLTMIVRRDPGMAEKLFGSDDNYPQVEHEVATRLIESDPRRAADIAKYLFERDQNYTRLSDFLEKLQRKDPSLSDELFGYALSNPPVDKERHADFFKGLFGYVFHFDSIPDDDDDFPRSPIPNTAARVDPALLTRFLDFGYNAVMVEAQLAQEESKKRNSPDERFGFGYMYLRKLLPYMEKHAPDKAAEIRARWDEAIRGFPGGERYLNEVDHFMRLNSVESVESEAEKAQDRQMKEGLYRRAAEIAMALGEFDKAFSVIGKIKDKETQAELKSKTHHVAAMVALAEGDLTRAHSSGKGITDARDRAKFYSQLARALREKNEAARAAEILREVMLSIAKEKDYYIKEPAMITIASAAARLDPALGFEVMKSLVRLMNEHQVGARKGGRKYVVSGLDFNESFPLLARADFDRALRLAQAIKASEPAMLAQVAACRGILVQN